MTPDADGLAVTTQPTSGAGAGESLVVPVHPALIWSAAFVVLILRRVQAVMDPEFIYEDGREFFMGAWYHGLESLATSYAGSLHVASRAIALAERLVPIQLAPLVGVLLSLAIVAGIAAYISSDALSNVIPDWRIRLVLASVFVLLPATEMTLGSPTFIQFYLGVFLVAGAVARRAGPVAFGAIAVAGLSGPFGILFSPLYVARAWLRRDRDAILRLVAVGVPATIQVLVLVTSARSSYVPPPTLDPEGIALVLGGHLLTQLMGGFYMVQAIAMSPPLPVAAAAVLIVCALIVGAARRLSVRELLVLGYAATAIVGAAFLLGTDERSLFINPLSAARYFMIPGAMLATFIILAASRGSRPAVALAAILAVGIVGDFRLSAYGTHDWWTESACIGGPSPCVVPVYPGGLWDIVWTPP